MFVAIESVLLTLRVLLEDLMGLGSQRMELVAPTGDFDRLVDVHPVMKSIEYTNKNYCLYMDIEDQCFSLMCLISS